MTKFLLLVLSIGFISMNATAHEGGHGPEIPGLGPNGGSLTAIIPATDVDAGDEAHVAGIAEWSMMGHRLVVHLHTPALSEPALVAPSELKWILLMPAPETPVILKIALTEPTTVLELEVPPGTKTVEAILSNFHNLEMKHVFAVSL